MKNMLFYARRAALPATLLLLAACQTMPTQPSDTTASASGASSSSETPAAPAPDAASQAPAPGTAGQAAGVEQQEARQEGAPVAVLLADTTPRDGWTPVNLREGVVLYVNPEPVVGREDLTGVQAGTGRQGEGLLALELNAPAMQRIAQATTQQGTGRLALVVGRTMMAAPAYDAPVTVKQLVFAVGTEQNALAAARAIAGMPQDAAATPAGADANATTNGAAQTSPIR